MAVSPDYTILASLFLWYLGTKLERAAIKAGWVS